MQGEKPQFNLHLNYISLFQTSVLIISQKRTNIEYARGILQYATKKKEDI
jgi:hypothetical protein